MTITAVKTMAQCEDCATLVEVSAYAEFHYCERHDK